MNHYFIDKELNKVTFPDARFYKTESGNWVPSVTTILDAYPKGPGYFEWLKRVGQDADAIRDKAGDQGTAVHDMTQAYDEGKQVSVLDDYGNIRCSMREWSMLERYVDFIQRFKPAIEHIELHISSDQLRFAGTIDRILKINDKRYVLDNKTSNAIYPHYWLQLQAYKKLWEEKQPNIKIDGVCILWLNAKTKTDGKGKAIQGEGWQLLTQESDDEMTHSWSLFKSTHALWLAENANLKPKHFSYNLTHKL